jgi:putative alpha-1,2-mannosidase
MNVPFNLFNDQTGFMEARNQDGSWAGEDRGWTEGQFMSSFSSFSEIMNMFTGDKWAYSFDVVHNVPELIARRGGRVNFVKSLEEHFEGGHNDHTNEVRLVFLSLYSHYYIQYFLNTNSVLMLHLLAFTPHTLPLRTLRSCVQGSGKGTRDCPRELWEHS